MLFIYLAILLIAGYWVIKTLGPEMAKPALPQDFDEEDPLDIPGSNGTDKRIEKFETLVFEKNKNIALLHRELRSLHLQIQSFDKVKLLLYQEIDHLREQNRIFRSELGLPAAQPKENSIV